MKPSPNALKGQIEIATYSRYSWPTILKMIEHDEFPAIRLNGKNWEADKTLIDFWKKSRILRIESNKE